VGSLGVNGDNIEMKLEDTACEGMDWIHVAQNRDQRSRKMEAARSSETSVSYRITTRRHHNVEDQDVKAGENFTTLLLW